MWRALVLRDGSEFEIGIELECGIEIEIGIANYVEFETGFEFQIENEIEVEIGIQTKRQTPAANRKDYVWVAETKPKSHAARSGYYKFRWRLPLRGRISAGL